MRSTLFAEILEPRFAPAVFLWQPLPYSPSIDWGYRWASGFFLTGRNRLGSFGFPLKTYLERETPPISWAVKRETRSG